jgi:hypothetical protein
MTKNPRFPAVSRDCRRPVRLTIDRYSDPLPAWTVPRHVLAIIASSFEKLPYGTRMMGVDWQPVHSGHGA